MKQVFENEVMSEIFNMVSMTQESFLKEYEKHGDSELVQELVLRIKDLERGVEKLKAKLNK